MTKEQRRRHSSQNSRLIVCKIICKTQLLTWWVSHWSYHSLVLSYWYDEIHPMNRCTELFIKSKGKSMSVNEARFRQDPRGCRLVRAIGLVGDTRRKIRLVLASWFHIKMGNYLPWRKSSPCTVGYSVYCIVVNTINSYITWPITLENDWDTAADIEYMLYNQFVRVVLYLA